MRTPLLMIPGPIELSPAVLDACARAPAGHLAPGFMASFGSALGRMRHVWKAGPDFRPQVLTGSGTLAMDQAISNLVDPGDDVLVVDTGYFSARIAEMAARRGAVVRSVTAEPGHAVAPDRLRAALAAGPPPRVVTITHVDTSTGVRVDVAGLAAAAREAGALVVVDGVCAIGGERLETEAWGVDVALTASQKAIGLPVGLALSMVSPAAWARREALRAPPPLALDWLAWAPVLEAYEAGRPSYFATPATSLIPALDVALGQILVHGLEAVIARHAAAAATMQAAWSALGLEPLPAPGAAANTLSALWLPEGVGPDLPAFIARHDVIVAGGLHPALRARYFRVGHMGWVTGRASLLERTVEAVRRGLEDARRAQHKSG